MLNPFSQTMHHHFFRPQPPAALPRRLRSGAFIACLCWWGVQLPAQTLPVLNIVDFGAKNDSNALSTVAIQAAIDRANANPGGGIVRVPAGAFRSGSLHLKSNVELQLDEGATLLGSTSRFDYSKITWHALLLADGQENIAVTGPGAIDGQGAALAADVVRLVKTGVIVDPYWGNNRPHERERPQLIEFVRCKNVRITGLMLRNSACWVQTYQECDGLRIERVRVESRAYWNNDGIDVVDSRNVLIRDCDINAADDGICLKSSFPPAFCENIVIENCRVRSSASALKFGTATRSGFRNVRVRNLQIADTYRSAIALEIVDGGFMENIEVSDILAKNTGNAIFIRLGRRNLEKPAGSIRHIRIHDVTVEVPTGRPDAGYAFEGPEVTEPHNLNPASITGLPGHPVRDVTLENIHIRFGGGGARERACVSPDSLDQVPERPADYPEFSMFGELPAWGFYVRHASGLRLKNIFLECVEPDFRPAFVFDDVQDLALKGVQLAGSGGTPDVVLRQVSDVHPKKMRRRGAKLVLYRPAK